MEVGEDLVLQLSSTVAELGAALLHLRDKLAVEGVLGLDRVQLGDHLLLHEFHGQLVDGHARLDDGSRLERLALAQLVRDVQVGGRRDVAAALQAFF